MTEQSKPPFLQLSRDRKRLRLSVSLQSSSVSIAADLTTAEVDAILAGLGRVRRQMADPHPIGLPGRRKRVSDVNPAWRIEMDPATGGVFLDIRDSGFGWLHFLLPASECTKLGSGLLRFATASARTPAVKH